MEEKSYLKRLVKDDQKEIDRNDFDRTKCSSDIHFLEQKLQKYKDVINSTVDAVKEVLNENLRKV